MNEQPILSLLIPTRNRGILLRDVINRFRETWCLDMPTEFCLKIDDDDLETIQIVDEINKGDIKKSISSRQNGYFNLPEFYEEMYNISSGKFILIWNDDAYLDEPGNLKEIIYSNLNNPCIITSCKTCNFPLVHRLIFEWIVEKYGNNFMNNILYYDGYILGIKDMYPEILTEYSTYRYSHLSFSRTTKVDEMIIKLGGGSMSEGLKKGWSDTDKMKKWLTETEHIRGMHPGHRVMDDWMYLKEKREEYLKL